VDLVRELEQLERAPEAVFDEGVSQCRRIDAWATAGGTPSGSASFPSGEESY
jgi:hypothetical protein